MTDPYRILITGTRQPLTHDQEWKVRTTLLNAGTVLPVDRPVVIVVGDCPTGVDALMAKWWGSPGRVTTETHKANWVGPCDASCAHGPRKRAARGYTTCPAAGPRRNAAMVAAGADVCLAFPLGESRGTKDCARRAQAAGIPTTITDLGGVRD